VKRFGVLKHADCSPRHITFYVETITGGEVAGTLSTRVTRAECQGKLKAVDYSWEGQSELPVLVGGFFG